MCVLYPHEFDVGTSLVRGDNRISVTLDQASGRVVFARKGADGKLALLRALTPDPRSVENLHLQLPGDETLVEPWVYQTWAIVDLETTGIGPDDKIVEIAVITMRFGKIIDRWSSLVNPGRPIPQDAVNVHGITDEMVANAPSIDQIRDEITSRLNAATVVIGYNIYGADEPWLLREGIRITMPVVDPLVIVRTKAVGKHWRGDYQPKPDADCSICGGDDEEPKPKRKGGGRHRLERAARELQCNAPEKGMQTELHRAQWDAVLAGRIMWVLRGEVGFNAAVTESFLRVEAGRQEAEILAFKAKKQAEDQAKRTTRAMLEARVCALEERLAMYEMLEERIARLESTKDTRAHV